MLGPQSQMDQKEHFQQASVIISVVVSHSQFCRITSNLTVFVWVVQIHVWVRPQFTGWCFSLLLIEQTHWGHNLNPPLPVMLSIMLYTAHTLKSFIGVNPNHLHYEASAVMIPIIQMDRVLGTENTGVKKTYRIPTLIIIERGYTKEAKDYIILDDI